MPRVVTANDLRWLGEEADGKRTSDLVVVWRTDSRGVETLGLSDPQDIQANEIRADQIQVKTELEGDGLLGDARLQIVLPDGRIIEVPDADCAFLTQSAFSKFVIPYYTRFKSPAQIAAMKIKYFHAEYKALVHFPPSYEAGITAEEDDAPANVKAVVQDGYVTEGYL
ncbi:MAG: hypothetical protein ABI120_03165 [Gemmatimonadaceae bacterium]